jgi:hypothetical protein
MNLDATFLQENLIQLVTREVMRELAARGIAGIGPQSNEPQNASDATMRQRIDMSKYRTPIITENAIMRMHERTATVLAPKGTILTPRAKELMRERNISVIYE